MEVLLHHDATDRRTDVDPVDHVLGGAYLLLDVVQIRLGLAQLLDRILKRRRVELGYSFVRLSDPLLRIGDAAAKLAELSPEARLGASQRQHIRLADQLLAKKRILVLQLFGEQGNTLFGGLYLRLISTNAFLQPGDLLPEYAFLGRQTGLACPQLGALPLENPFGFRITCALAECSRSFDCL